jgi:hypothetical protein
VFPKRVSSMFKKGAMKKICLAALLFVTAGFCLGQEPKSSLNVPSTDIFGGFITTSLDYTPPPGIFTGTSSFRVNGGELAISKRLTNHISVIAVGDGSTGSIAHVKQLSATAGVKYNFMTGKFRPYATGQLGYALQHSHSLYFEDHHPPQSPHIPDVEKGLVFRLGGGADLQISPKFYVRLIQWDVQPQPVANNRPLYENISFGAGYCFGR